MSAASPGRIPLQPDPISPKTEVKKGAAGLVGVLGAFLESWLGIADKVHSVFGIPNEVTISATLFVGYSYLCYYAYHVICEKHPRLKSAVIVAAILPVAGVLFGATYWFLQIKKEEVQSGKAAGIEWADLLLSDENAQGGFSNETPPNATPDARPDAWTTAQGLTALLLNPSRLSSMAGRVKDGFAWLENARREDGGWTPDPEQATQTQTEIAGWVCVAYCLAIQSGQIWQPNSPEYQAAVSTAVDILRQLRKRQNPDTHGWGPTSKPGVGKDRTYSVIMSLWAFIEGQNRCS